MESAAPGFWAGCHEKLLNVWVIIIETGKLVRYNKIFWAVQYIISLDLYWGKATHTCCVKHALRTRLVDVSWDLVF